MSTDVTALLEARSQARSERNWAEADRLRKLIEDQGYQVVDRKDGTSELKGGQTLSVVSDRPYQDSNYSQVVDADGKLWGYALSTWDNVNKRLVTACRINDVRSRTKSQ